MPLSPGRFNGLLANLGQNVLWRRAQLCPCRDRHSDAARQDCPVCNGKGQFWGAPQAAFVGLSSMKTQQQWATFGAYEQGDVVVTLPSDSPIYGLADGDRVLFTNSTVGFSQIFRRGVDDDPLPFAVHSIERVFWLDPDGEMTIDGGIPIADADGHLRWASATPIAPPPGQQYSMIGRKNTEYFVALSSLVQDRAHHQGAKLPRKCVLRPWDLYGR